MLSADYQKPDAAHGKMHMSGGLLEQNGKLIGKLGNMLTSSSGLGHHPLKVETGDHTPVIAPNNESRR